MLHWTGPYSSWPDDKYDTITLSWTENYISNVNKVLQFDIKVNSLLVKDLVRRCFKAQGVVLGAENMKAWSDSVIGLKCEGSDGWISQLEFNMVETKEIVKHILPGSQHKTMCIVVREVRAVTMEDWRLEDTILISDVGVVNGAAWG